MGEAGEAAGEAVGGMSEAAGGMSEAARAMGEAEVGDAAGGLRSALPSIPHTAVVIGSGLAALEESLADPVAVPFSDLPGLPAAGVSGHSGRFVHGRLGSAEVLVQAGRFHVYEGHPLDVVVAPVRILAAAGVETVIMTNASGGIRASLEPGDVVLVDDVLNVMLRSPLAGPVVGDEPRFPDMSRPFDAELSETVRAAADELGIRLERGVYAAVLGPAYETAAEIRMLARLGADVVGMSTVPEVIAAAACGLRCAALSLVTNKATGLATGTLSHEEVLEVGRAAGTRVEGLVEAVVARWAARRGERGAPRGGVAGRSRQSGEAK